MSATKSHYIYLPNDIGRVLLAHAIVMKSRDMPGAPLLRLTYYSRNAITDACADAPREVERILTAAKRNNACGGITGVLLRSEGHFAQLLEGPPEAVERAFERVRRDWRHADLVVLRRRPAQARMFDGCPMAHVWEPEIEAWRARDSRRFWPTLA